MRYSMLLIYHFHWAGILLVKFFELVPSFLALNFDNSRSLISLAVAGTQGAV